MVGRTPLDYSSVPQTAELENNSNQTKYTVNKSPKGDLLISRPACALFVMGALLLAAVAAVVTFFLLPRCNGNSAPQSLTENEGIAFKDDSAVEYVRLPRSIQPTHYRINILPFIGGNFTTNGNVTIALKINEDTSKISLNVKDLDIDPASVTVKNLGRNDENVKINRQGLNADRQTYSFELGENLVRDQDYEIRMSFTGYLNDYMVGFYRSHYTDSNNVGRWLASTQFSPTDARRAFPCFDEPSFKAKFTISIARPLNMLSLSNMPKNDSLALISENLVWDNYLETPPMSSYLVAFAVLDFVPFRHNSSGKLFTIWSPQGSQQYTSYAINLGPRILQYYENYFNMSYPLPKIDIVAIPDFGFSAMENWGLITFRESKLLYDPRTSTVDIKRDITTILSHELAHQWFGNLVTPSWWDDLWLKEGFATYFEYLGASHVAEASWKIMDEFYFSETMRAFNLDSLSSSRPIHFEVQNSNDIRQAFDAISYSKGAALIRMMSSFLGENTFKEGLKKFLDAKQYSNANHDDLWEALTEQAHDDGKLVPKETIKEIMDSWIHEAGFPVVTVIPDYGNQSLRFTQKRFLLHGKQEDDVKWWVPIWYTDASSSFKRELPDVWLKGEAETTIKANLTKWYILNFNQDGYYIVNYDENNWKLLIENVMNLPSVTRAHLISDSMDLARAGLLDYDIPLKFVETMSARDRDIEFVPILTVFEKLTFLDDILKSTPAFGNFEAFVLSSYSFVFDNVGFDDSPSDTYPRQRIRRVVLEWACKKQESRCTIDSRVRYRNWMVEGATIEPNLRDVIYCTAIREEGEAEWNFAYKTYLKTKSASEKETLLRALGCSSKHWLLARYLDLMLQNNSTIRKQDGALVFSSVAHNFVGRHLAFDFLRSNWNRINDYFGVAFGTVREMVESIPTYMHTDFELKQIEHFKNENKYKLGTTEQAFDHAIEAVKTNIEWMTMNYKSVETWLKNQMSPYG